MKKAIDQIIEAISSKGAIPSEKAQQIAHFNRLIEFYHNLSKYLEVKSSQKKLIQAELKENYISYEKLLADSLNFNFIDYANHEAFFRAIGRLTMAVINLDSSKMSQILELIVAGIKPKNILKNLHFQVLEFLLEFRNNLPPISYPNMNEILQSLLKLLKKNKEIPLRVGSMRIFRYLIREQVNTNINNKTESYRLITKFIISEKSEDLRKEAIITLADFLQQADAPFMAPFYEELLPELYKQLQETKDWEVKKLICSCIQALIELYINGDMEALINSLKTKKVKKELAPKPMDNGEPKDKYKLMLTLLTDHMNGYSNQRLLIIEIFNGVAYKQESALTASFLSSVLELFFSHINKMAFAQLPELILVRDAMGLFVIKFLVFLNSRQKFELYEYLKKKLVDFGKVYKDTYLRYLQNPTNMNCIKNQQSLQNQSLVALRCFFALVQTLGSDVFEQITSPNQLCEPLSPFFYFNNKQFYLLGSHVLRALFSENPKWQTNILSLILNLMTLDLAELESMKEIYNIQDPQFRLYASSIYGHSIALGNLLKHMDFNLHSIPYDIAMTMFEFAKGQRNQRKASLKQYWFLTSNRLVKNEYKAEDLQNEELHQINSIRFQAGWTLINSLLCLDVNWLKQEIKSIQNMWIDILGQDRKFMKNLNNFICDLNAKRQALKGLLYFLKNLSRLHTEPVIEFCVNLVIKFYTQYITPSEKDLGFAIPKQNPDFLLAKIDLYSCLNCIPPKYVVKHVNALIQTSVEDIFSSNPVDYTSSLKGLMESDDLNLSLELSERSVRFRLFNSSNIKKLIDPIVEKNEDHLLSYDSVFLKYQEKNYAFQAQLSFQQFDFIGRVLSSNKSSNCFTSKNKSNLLKFMVNNQIQCLSIKENYLRNIKLQPYLLATIFIAKKIRESQSKNQLEPIENEIVNFLQQMAENGFASEDHIIKALSSAAFSLLLGIKAVSPIKELLFKQLEEKVMKAETISTVAACIGFICKNNKYRLIESNMVDIGGILQKASKNGDMNTQIWLLHSLSKSIESYSESAIEIVRACFLFIYLQHIRQKLPIEHLWNSLYKNLLEKMLKLVRKQPQLAQDKSLFSHFHNAFWEVQHQAFPYKDLSFADNDIASNYLSLIYVNVFTDPQEEKQIIALLKQQLEQIYNYNTSSIKMILKSIDTIIKDKKTDQIGQDFLLNHLIRKMNYYHTRKDYYIAESIEVLYTALIEEKQKMTREECEKKLSRFQFVLFGESFELKQNSEDGKEGEEGKKASSQKQVDNYQKEDQIDINLKTKMFILSCVENFLREWEITEVEQKKLVGFIDFIFNFIFKIITSSHDEFRAPGMQILMNFLAKIKKTTDEGEILKEKIDYEEQRNLLLKDYAAQIDSIVSQNIKNENKNTPEVNIFTFQILSKFFKIILNSDIGFIRKLISLVAKPLFTNIKSNSQFNKIKVIVKCFQLHSSHSTVRNLQHLSKSGELSACVKYTSLFKTELRILNSKQACLEYFLPCNIDIKLTNQLITIFQNSLLQYLFQNIQAAILDSAVVLTASRKQIKSYNNYYLIYNGVKTSYDVKMHFYLVANFIKYYLVLSQAIQQCSNQEENDPEEKELLHKLRSNDKYLSIGPKMSHICYSVLLFQLCSNTSADQEEQYLKKLSTQMLDVSLLKKLNYKLNVLTVLKQLLSSKIKELLTDVSPPPLPLGNNNNANNNNNVINKVSTQPLSFDELFASLLPYLDYGLKEYDQLSLDIATIVLKSQALIQPSVLIQAEQLLDLILARYLEESGMPTKEGNNQASLNLIKSAFILKLSLLKSTSDISSIPEKFAFSAYFLFCKLSLRFTYTDILPLRKAFVTISNLFELLICNIKKIILFQVKDKMAQLPNEEESINIQDQIATTVTELLLSEIQKNQSQPPKQYKAMISYFSVYDSISPLVDRFQKDSQERLKGNFAYIISISTNQEFLSFITQILNENKQLDEQILSPIFLISSQVIINLKSRLSSGQQIDAPSVASVNSILKIFLLINNHGSDEQRKASFEAFLRFFMLFVHQRFSQPDGAEILQLVNQVLKHFISAINLQDLGLIIRTLPPKLQQIVQNLLKTDQRIIQAQQAQQKAQQQQQAPAQKGLQLKTFG